MSVTHDPIILSALKTIKKESDGLEKLSQELTSQLGNSLIEAVNLIHNIKGRVIITGIGKSGHIGTKIAATMASTGTPAYFVHPTEASHGDLGMIRPSDAVLALSWSGETTELAGILSYISRFKVPLIALTSGKNSTLAKAANIVLSLPKIEEACPHGLAPTTSTLIQMAMGDAISIALLEKKGFTPNQFKNFHPGGQLGAKLSYVRDIMRNREHIALVPPDMKMDQVLLHMTEKNLGCAGIINHEEKLCGIITDGDLRRAMQHQNDFITQTASIVMTENPITIEPDMLATAALAKINTLKVSTLFVVNNGKPVGIVHMHDLIHFGIV